MGMGLRSTKSGSQIHKSEDRIHLKRSCAGNLVEFVLQCIVSRRNRFRGSQLSRRLFPADFQLFPTRIETKWLDRSG